MKEQTMIRYEAARRLAQAILTDKICNIELTPQILDTTANTIMSYVRGDEIKQDNERNMKIDALLKEAN
jgi:hypothetical protein